MKDTITSYQEIRNRLDTFTIINCIPKGFIWSKIGHTAELDKSLVTGQVSLFESTTLNKFTGKSGVQLNPFGLWLNNYPGKVYARIPTFQDCRGDSKDHDYWRRRKAEAFIKEHLNSSYPDLKAWSGRLKLAFAALDYEWFGIDLLTYNGADDGIFCTMLLIMKLQYCGLFTPDMNAAEFEPDDTRGGRIGKAKFEDNLLHCTYGEEIRLK